MKRFRNAHAPAGRAAGRAAGRNGSPTGRNGSAPARRRVLLVDEHPAIRQALHAALRADATLEVVGETGSGSEAISLIETLLPEVVVTDLSLDDGHGLDLLHTIRTQFPRVFVVVFSMYEESVFAERVLRAGAGGFVSKHQPTRHVVDAVHAVLDGEFYFSPAVASRIVRRAAQGEAPPAGLADRLSDREMAVFQMLGEGYSVEAISQRLHLSRKTVEHHRRRSREKLGLDSTVALLQHAVEWVSGGHAS